MDLLVYGLVDGAGLLLMALGFSLVYGVSRLPNFAHGALYVFSGYLAWVFLVRVGLPYPVAALLAVLAAAVLGAVLYVLVLRRVRGMEMSEVIATYAIGLVIVEVLRYAGLRGTTHMLPPFADGVVEVFGVALSWQRVFVVLCAAGVVGLLWLFTRRTRLGLALRGVAQDERAAMMLGIDSDRMATVAVALGGALAAVAALVLLPLGGIVAEAHHEVLVSALAVCVVGGLGSWTGTIVASVLLAYSQNLAVALGKPHYGMVVMIAAIILTLIFRPSGLFGRQKALEERV